MAESTALSPELLKQLEQATALKKLPLGKLISLYENRSNDAMEKRHLISRHLASQESTCKGLVVGFTGTPGAGKSSLIAELSKTLLRKDDEITIAVLAVDPSSQVSGGSILGDRTRMRTNGREPRLFFRSQASNLELGGVTQNTYQATRLLKHFFDIIIIETVGIGQNEIDIQYMTDHTYLVMQPLAGDQIQFMKCGIMEIPDSFVVNKCDEEKLARMSYHMLRTSLKQAKLVALDANDDFTRASKDNIFLTSAVKGTGIDTLADHLLTLQSTRGTDRDLFYLKKRIQTDFGNFGLQVFSEHEQSLSTLDTFETKESFIREKIQARIR
ncbi:MAG: GTP-binding protein [Ketobacteraceae bacterium]|nr:GTP-binding protein [Ketobacteraceae bacterium]